MLSSLDFRSPRLSGSPWSTFLNTKNPLGPVLGGSVDHFVRLRGVSQGWWSVGCINPRGSCVVPTAIPRPLRLLSTITQQGCPNRIATADERVARDLLYVPWNCRRMFFLPKPLLLKVLGYWTKCLPINLDNHNPIAVLVLIRHECRVSSRVFRSTIIRS